jgi:hypothetical protein
MSHESAVNHLSPSHLFCWRTLAVTLELFPTPYRKCLFQLVLVPPGMLVSTNLLTAIWDVTPAELPAITSMFSTVSFLNSLPGPDGERWYVTNVVRDYLVYWARISGKGGDISSLQRWLLARRSVVAHICNPFSQSGFLPLLRPTNSTQEMTLLARNVRILSDEAVASAAVAAASTPIDTPESASYALVLAAAAANVRLLDEAAAVIAAAARWFSSNGGSPALECQIRYWAAHILVLCGNPVEGMQQLEGALVLASDPAVAAAPFVQVQIISALINCARAKRDRKLMLSLCKARLQVIEQHAEGSTQDAVALLELAHAQIASSEPANDVKKVCTGSPRSAVVPVATLQGGQSCRDMFLYFVCMSEVGIAGDIDTLVPCMCREASKFCIRVTSPRLPGKL